MWIVLYCGITRFALLLHATCHLALVVWPIYCHLAHAAAQDHERAYVRTVDSNVVVLAIHVFPRLGLSELWVCLGSGKKSVIPHHDIRTHLRPSRSLALPLFHALTGFGTTSQFLGCGKKTTWASWQYTPGLTELWWH